MKDQEWRLKELQLQLDTLVKTSHPEPSGAVYYWYETKWGQIPDLKFHEIYVCENDQYDTSCRKPWIYQVPQLK